MGKHQLIKISFFLIFLLSSHFALPDEAKTYSILGTASDFKGQLIYTENTIVTETSDGLAQKIHTDYKNSKGELIARMTSTFSNEKFIPQIEFEDLRFQFKNNLKIADDGKSLIIEHTEYKKPKTSKTEIKIKENMVAGSGFHNFLITQFNDLKSGKPFNIDFVVLAKADYFNFDIIKKEETDKTTKFSMKVHSWFLRQFLNPIEVEYDNKTKRLLRFRGLTNIQSDAGKPQELDILYKDIE